MSRQAQDSAQPSAELMWTPSPVQPSNTQSWTTAFRVWISTARPRMLRTRQRSKRSEAIRDRLVSRSPGRKPSGSGP